MPKKLSVDVKKKIDQSFLKLFTKDLQPFSIVEDPGFKEFVKLLNPNYQIPNRHTISKILIPSAYETCLNNVKEIISKELVTCCMTTDCWTSRCTESYLAITIHFIDKSFKLNSFLLSCHHFNETHTSLNLSENIKSTLEAWNLENKIILAVSDNAYNIKNALNSLQLKSFGCFAHTLNLIVQAAMKTESNLIDKIKTIVSHFHKSSNSHQKLIQYQKNIGIKDPKKLVQDVSTRWNSTFYMVERFVELENSIRGTLGLIDKPPPSLNPEEWQYLKELRSILKPFEEATRAVSGQLFMTASMVIVIAQGLQHVCNQLKNSNYTTRAKTFIQALVNEMNNRQTWGNIERSKTLARCTFLDPRFKTVPFSNNSVALESVKQNVIELTAKIISLKRSEVLEHSTETTQVPESTNLFEESNEPSIWDNVDQKVAQMQPSIGTSTSQAITEIQRYLDDTIIKRNLDPLAWWCEHQYYYPFLSILARKTLCCLGSSVPCERVFSKAGLIVSDRRCRLKPTKIQQLLFLNNNS